MKKEEYIEQMRNVKASDELIEKTINNIKTNQKMKKTNEIKKFIAGIAAMAFISVGSVGAYAGITGNTKILEKFGINVSKNYEDNKQLISEDLQGRKIKNDKIELNLTSAAIDDSSVVLEFNLKLLDKEITYNNPDFKIENLMIYQPNKDITSSNGDIVWNVETSSEKMEDGTYKIFKYISVQDLMTDGSFNQFFYEEEYVDLSLGIYEFIDLDTNEIIYEDPIGGGCNMEVKLSKPNNLDQGDVSEINGIVHYKDIEIKIESVKRSTFGNTVSIFATQKNIDLENINDIQKLKLLVKDENGNDIKVSSEAVNVTMGDYKNGQMNTVTLEISLKLDDVSENAKYSIEGAEDESVKVSLEKLNEISNSLVENYKSGGYVYTTDGVSYIIDGLENGLEDEVYEDEYGVHFIDKSAKELDAQE